MDIEHIRDNLKIIEENQRQLPALRHEWVQKAREAGMTWREIAEILGMTQHGLIKAQKAFEPK